MDARRSGDRPIDERRREQPRRRRLRRLRNVALIFLGVLLIFFLWAYLAIMPAMPLEKGETAVLPERTKDPEGRWRVGRNWAARDTFGLHQVYIEGTPLERGLAYGALTTELIREQERIFTDRIKGMVPGGMRLGYLKYFAAWFNRNMDDHVPLEYQREIYAVSRAFSDTFDGIGPKYMRALNYHAAHDIGHVMQDLAMVGCTSFAAWGERTPDGQLLVARNFDFWMGDDFARDKLITFINPNEGIPHVLVSWGGFMGAVSAMNLEGLTVTINASRSELPTGARTPVSLLARNIVQYASTLDEAVAIARAHDVFVSESFLVASAHDGRAVIIEKDPEGTDVFPAEKDLVVCANHFQSERFANTEVNRTNERESDSMNRFRRMRKLVDSTAVMDATNAVTILRDRRGPDGGEIGMANPMAINQLIAHHSVVFQPGERRMWVSTAPFQCGAFVCYDLRDVFARSAAGSMHGAVHDTALTIAASPEARSAAMVGYLEWSRTRLAINDHVMSGRTINLDPEAEARFVAQNPNSYITYLSLADLRKSDADNDAAAALYRKALSFPLPSLQERASIERKLQACTP